MKPVKQPQPAAISPHRIHPQTRPGFVHLKVASLASQLLFYQQVIGLKLNWQSEESAGLGVAGRDLVRLTQIRNGKRVHGVTGLYHVAILFPSRRELARAVARLFARRADGTPSDGREPLDLEALFAHLNKDDRLNDPLPAETRIGHFHLYVSSLEKTRRFYHELLGFDDMGTASRFRMGAVSAGGYHHHIGYNTWQGEGAPPPPPDALGLLYIAFDLPEQTALSEIVARLEHAGIPHERRQDGLFLRDPSQNGVLFRVQEG